MKYCLALLLVLFLASLSRADTIFVSIPNSGISSFPGPYAKVDINLVDSTHATVSLTSLVQSGNIYLFGGAGLFGLNTNGTVSISNLIGSNSGTGFSSPQLSSGGSQNLDGFGTFNTTINGFDGYTHTVDSLSFTLTDLSGTWLNSKDVLAKNGDGFLLAGHIFVAAFPANASAGALATGFGAGDSFSSPPPPPPPPPPPAVPEPASCVLVGLGIAGLLGYKWRRRNR